MDNPTPEQIEHDRILDLMENDPKPGRPPLYGESLVNISARLKIDEIEWLRRQPDGLSGTLRSLIDQAMQDDDKP